MQWGRVIMSNQTYHYSPSRFRDRVQVIQLIKGMAKNIQNGDIKQKALVVNGDRGSGKSWLALHLVREVFKEETGITTFLVRLWPNYDNEKAEKNEWWLSSNIKDHPGIDADTFSRNAISEIITMLAKRLNLPALEQAPLPERSRNIVLSIQNLAQRQILVLVIDSAFESDRSQYKQVLQDLQDHLTT